MELLLLNYRNDHWGIFRFADRFPHADESPRRVDAAEAHPIRPRHLSKITQLRTEELTDDPATSAGGLLACNFFELLTVLCR